MHIHILGVCGTFMGGIAAIAQTAGYKVTGCDAQAYPPMSDQLRGLGIELIEGFEKDQVNVGADIFVIGNVVSRGKQPLMEEILNRALPYISGPQWLAENILYPLNVPAKTHAAVGVLPRSHDAPHGKWTLAVAGTHGKTTTSSMLAWILEDAGLNPGFLIGGIPQNFGISARLTDSPFFVIEADEYDTAFFDKRSKFVHYRPRTALLNNLEYDHADIFPDLAAIETQFHHLVRTLPGEGLIVANRREESLKRVIERGCWTPLEWFGAADNWSAEGGESCFDVQFKGETLGHVEWNMMGEHNRMNALGAIACARHVGVSAPLACEALCRFQNVKRRMEMRGTVNGITVYDDFAHHPSAIETTVEGLRSRVGTARILAVLEPRSNTMKLGALNAQLPASLKQADKTFCYGANLGWNANEVFSVMNGKAEVQTDLDALVSAIANEARPGDHILVMSNGGFGGIHQKILDRLGQ
jgi:UDP-N-acetylmuramate: L-alanyl-gamma-D-glutamyl-meso-diaminopimelate ligase